MTTLADTSDRYGYVSRALHWGMAVLFAAQFASGAAHWALARGNGLRDALWSYHTDLGATLFLLVLLRGIWGLLNIAKRPAQSGAMGLAAMAGHLALYGLMIAVPAVRLLAAAGSTRGLHYLGIQVVQGREVEVAWMQAAAEWHGEMAWALAFLVLGHIAMAIIWHRLIQRDGVLGRMA